MGVLGTYLIPILYLIFAYMFLVKKPKFGDRDGFSTKRAKENEEIWNYVQRTAGIYCLAAAIVIGGLIFGMSEAVENFEETKLFWVQVGAEVASIALIVPVVNLLTNLKFPGN